MLYNISGDAAYLGQALRNARALAAAQRDGNATHAPWPFRVDSVTGTGFSRKSCNIVFPLRLFELLVDLGFPEFSPFAERLWHWIVTFQLASNASDPAQSLWVGFYEDMVDPAETNRNAWCPLETARYLIEKRRMRDPAQWRTRVQRLLDASLHLFGLSRPGNVTLIGEQDKDHKPWGGTCSKLPAVAALYACAGGPPRYRRMAELALSWLTYFTDTDGCPAALLDAQDGAAAVRGGWQEDAHTDVVHNWIDTLDAMSGIC